MRISKIMLLILLTILLISCETNESDIESENNDAIGKKKIGVLIVSHGSHSDKWREMLSATTDSVKDEILQNKNISSVKSAFMEYNEPSIATRMKEFDNEGFTDVVIVPLFLTVSGHSFDDIPHIVGLKTGQAEQDMLKQENIEVYKAKANIKITPLLDFPKSLGDNLVNRVNKLSTDPENEACVLVAYGDRAYNEEWIALLKNMNTEIEAKTGINHFEYSWCGHIVEYDMEPTTSAVERALKKKKKAIVMPVLVAVDEMFQVQIIGGAIDKVKEKDRVVYKPDSILPDKNIEQWIIDIANKTVSEIL